MWTGRQTLRSIEEAIGQLHGRERGLDEALRQLAADAERLRAERAEALRQLARVKLDEIASGRLTEGLDAAERRASALLASRGDRLARLAQARDAALSVLAEAEAARDREAEQVEAALAALEALHEATETTLRKQPDWQAADAAVREAIAVAEEARRKAELNAAELAEKKRPYDDDPLFRYLWDRGFGTPAYNAGTFVRMVDRWVANFTGYADLRANYHMLGEIPLRLAEHAESRHEAVAAREAQRASLERAALVTSGIEDAERALAQARADLGRADASLDAARAELDRADAARDAMLSGAGDPEFLAAVASLATADAQDDIATLWREARRTATGEDDALVRRIEQIDSQLTEIGAELTRTRAAAGELAQRRTEVEQARDRFRKAGYDHPHAGFGNERVIVDVLGGILAGVLKGSSLWDILREGYSQRPPRGRPDFGGGFPFPLPRRKRGDDDDDDDDDDDRRKRRPRRDRVAGGDWRIPTTSGGWAPDRGGGATGRNDSDDFITGGRF